MATIFSIKVGAAVAVTLSFADDTKATAVLLGYYDGFRLGPDTATNKQKLEAVIREMLRRARDDVRAVKSNMARAAAEAQILADTELTEAVP